jgi:hypothetical protein
MASRGIFQIGDSSVLVLHRLLENHQPRAAKMPTAAKRRIGPAQAKEGPTMTVLIYVNTSKQVGGADHLKVFANPDARKHGSRKMTPKAWHSNMRSWSEYPSAILIGLRR